MQVTDADAQQLGMPSGPDLLPVLLGRSSGSLVYMRVVLQLLAWKRQAEGLQPSGEQYAPQLGDNISDTEVHADFRLVQNSSASVYLQLLERPWP